MRVCIVAVCYNAYEDAFRLLKSIDEAIIDDVYVTVVLSDNSTEPPPKRLDGCDYRYDFHYVKNKNVGYFPAFNAAIERCDIKPDEFDFVAISNVDLVLESSFFAKLKQITLEPDVGVLAPSIISMGDGRDLNPKMKNRPSVKQIKFLQTLFKHPFLFYVYNKLLRIRELKKAKSLPNKYASSPYMYGAHGSFILFTRTYFENGASINYPRFLFGEEGFVAEQALMFDLKILHAPDLIINDREHGTTSQQPSAAMCAEHVKSYDYYLSHFR